jgi:hypothetical protein
MSIAVDLIVFWVLPTLILVLEFAENHGSLSSMAGIKRKLNVAVIAVVILFIGWVVGLGCYPFVMWSPLNCSNIDVHISNGRIRYQRYLLGICVGEQIEESLVSRALQAGDTSPNWHTAVTVSPLVNYSPNHRFGAAPSQIKNIGFIWDAATFTSEAKQRTCQTVVELWQKGEYAGAADDYIESLDMLVRNRRQHPQPYTAEELPELTPSQS